MKTLTARQKEVLDFISSYIDDHAYPLPSAR
jgi:SOS-response transcriptional repressor LexA